jgi:hypothetical protein
MFAVVVSARIGNETIPVRALTGGWTTIDEAMTWAIDHEAQVWKDEGDPGYRGPETIQPVPITSITPEEGA